MNNLIRAVIFDLDGVLVTTDEYHYQAWGSVCNAHGWHFDRKLNERLRGVSRLESLKIILDHNGIVLTDEAAESIADEKNSIYRSLLDNLGPRDVLPGVPDLLASLGHMGLRLAVGSSSRNARTILEKTGLWDRFEVVIDGTHLKRSKPDPEVFLLAARALGLDPKNCIVFEDAEAGLAAAFAAGMPAVPVGTIAQGVLRV